MALCSGPSLEPLNRTIPSPLPSAWRDRAMYSCVFVESVKIIAFSGAPSSFKRAKPLSRASESFTAFWFTVIDLARAAYSLSSATSASIMRVRSEFEDADSLEPGPNSITSASSSSSSVRSSGSKSAVMILPELDLVTPSSASASRRFEIRSKVLDTA